jgi:hypothetical protein
MTDTKDMDALVEAAARAMWDVMHPTGTTWDQWATYAAKTGVFDGRDTCRKYARAAIRAILPITMESAAGVADDHAIKAWDIECARAVASLIRAHQADMLAKIEGGS